MSDDTSKTTHYFSATPSAHSQEMSYTFETGNRTVTIVSDRGVFSASGLDKGTAVLLRHLDIEDNQLPPGDIVDVGCGAGPLTIALAIRYPNRVVWGIDVNPRALDLTRRNARANGLSNIRVGTPDDFVADKVAALWSNPPIRVGKTELQGILRFWLARLDDKGRCRLVVSKNLGGDSLQRWIIENGFTCERIASKTGFRILDVSCP